MKINYTTKKIVDSFSISTVGLGLLFCVYIVQYLRPLDLIGIKAPLFSLFSALLILVLIARGNIDDVLKHIQIRWILVLFTLLLFLTLTSSYPGRSFTMFLGYVQLIPFVFAVVLLIDTFTKFKALILMLSLTTLSITCYVFLTHHRFARYEIFDLSNFLTDPNDLSLYLNMMIPWMILSVSMSRTWWFKLGLGIGIFAVILLSLLTYSRGGFLGLVVTLGIFGILHPQRILFISGGILLGLLGLLFLDQQWLTVMSSATDVKTDTAITRITMWKAALEMFQDNPFGYGPATIGSVAYKYIPNGILGHGYTTWQGQVSHSQWVTALAEWGIFGFGIFIWLIVLNLRDCWTLMMNNTSGFARSCGITALSSLVGFLVSSSFLTTNYYPHFLYITAIICSAIFIFNRPPPNHHSFL